MKNEQRQTAQNLYFQTDLNKSQIAETLGVNRRTIMLWVQQGNWDRLKMSSQHMPSIIVEKCYYMLNHYLDNLLSANNTISTFGPKEAAAISSMASSIKKVRTRSSVNESMEMMTFFLEDVRRKDPDMAVAMRPFVEQYLASRSAVNINDFLPANFNHEGFIDDSDEQIQERWLDEKDQLEMDQDYAAWKQKKAEAAMEAALREAAGNGAPAMNNDKTVNERPNSSTPASSATKPPFKPAPAHDMPPVNNYQKPPQASKLTHELEKQLTEYLKQPRKTAA